MSIYMIPSGAAFTTSSFVVIACGTDPHTLVQVHLGDSITQVGRIVEWGVSFDGSSGATPAICELFASTTGTTGMTAHAATSIIDYDAHAHRHEPNADNFPFAYGTAETAFSDGTVTVAAANVRLFDVQHIAPTNQFVKQWPLGREPMFDPDDFVQLRVHASAAVNAIAYVIVEI